MQGTTKMTRHHTTLSSLFVLSILAAVFAATPMAAASEPLEPIYFQKIEIDGFWRTQFKRLTERWIPHCIKQIAGRKNGVWCVPQLALAARLQRLVQL
jgi:hypothetical protein